MEVGKARQEAYQGLFQSADIQRLVKGYGPGSKRAFEFFARWKSNNVQSMQLPAFLSLGDCFGILNKEALTKVFRQIGGQGMVPDQLHEALLLCAMQTVELELGGKQVAVDEETKLWRQSYIALCKHMLLGKPKDLQTCLDNFRKTNKPLSKFGEKPKAAVPEKAAPVEAPARQPSDDGFLGGMDDLAEADSTLPPSGFAPEADGSALDEQAEAAPADDSKAKGEAGAEEIAAEMGASDEAAVDAAAPAPAPDQEAAGDAAMAADSADVPEAAAEAPAEQAAADADAPVETDQDAAAAATSADAPQS